MIINSFSSILISFLDVDAYFKSFILMNLGITTGKTSIHYSRLGSTKWKWLSLNYTRFYILYPVRYWWILFFYKAFSWSTKLYRYLNTVPKRINVIRRTIIFLCVFINKVCSEFCRHFKTNHNMSESYQLAKHCLLDSKFSFLLPFIVAVAHT